MRMSFEVDGQRLRQLRVERALSLRALGQRSGVAFATINNLENGNWVCPASTDCLPLGHGASSQSNLFIL